jgi:hypothetical protein
MQVRRCPHCDLPLLADEITDGLCPTCGTVIDELAQVAPEPAPEEPPPSAPGSGRFLLGALAGGLLALVVAWPISAWMSAPTTSEDEVDALRKAKEQAESEARSANAGRTSAEKKLRVAEKKLGETEKQLTTTQQGLADALAQQKVSGEQLARIAEQFLELKADFAALQALRQPRDPPTTTRTINVPNMIYKLQPLVNGAGLKLVGQAKTLQIMAVGNNSFLDASELRVQEIIVVGAINDGARVRLSAPEGRITIPEISGRATVEIRAPNGTVVIRVINGDAQVTMTGKDIDFADFIDGDRTQVTATVTNDGRLHFQDLRGSSRLHWKKDRPTDREPTIEKGTVKPPAEFRKLD